MYPLEIRSSDVEPEGVVNRRWDLEKSRFVGAHENLHGVRADAHLQLEGLTLRGIDKKALQH